MYVQEDGMVLLVSGEKGLKESMSCTEILSFATCPKGRKLTLLILDVAERSALQNNTMMQVS